MILKQRRKRNTLDGARASCPSQESGVWYRCYRSWCRCGVYRCTTFWSPAAAANSLEDIKKLCDYAHQFRAKVHVTVNTIIYENEMEDTLKMIAELDRIGVDALLLQDMGVLWDVRANQLWHRELHSSTQCDARSADKVAWLSTLGFDRVVLARELSLDEIGNPQEKSFYAVGGLCAWCALC